MKLNKHEAVLFKKLLKNAMDEGEDRLHEKDWEGYFLYDGEKKYLQQIKKSKKFVVEFCKKNELKCKMTNANFFHLYFNKRKIKNIFFKLKKNKILVKSNYLGSLVKTDQSIRITLGSKEQMKFFFNNLMKVL